MQGAQLHNELHLTCVTELHKKIPHTSYEAPHVGLGAEARSQPYVGAIAAAAALSYVKWPVLWLHHRRRARRPGATGPYSKKAHPRHHNSLSPLPWKQQANKKKQLYICTYNKKCNHLPRIETWSSSTNTKNYVLLSRSFNRDKISKPSRKKKQKLPKSQKAKRRKLDQKCQGTAAAGTWRKPSSAMKRKGCGRRKRLPSAT